MREFDDSPSLESLVASASVGDEEAALEVYGRYNAVVCRFTLHLLRQKGCGAPADHSEDIIISAWLAIFEHLHQLEQSESIKPWMYKIILRLVLDHVSGPKGCISNQQKRLPLEAAEEARIESADKVYQDRILANEIRRRAKAQSSKFAEVMRLHVEEGYTMEEIARRLGESPAKVRSMYYRNLSYLRELFKDADDDDGGGSTER